ncbi:hypothetical protein A2U01_0002816 [Trifolium medium]|uniref:Copia protein n=1 Tax=Trifolium medium TaxID=97028 RepID=A0A392M3U4_9FABA|nr:hypothetical protein [Trifolium medium]
MSSCKSCPTPVDTKSKMSVAHGVPYEDPSLHRSLVGALQYLTFTRPDISYVVQQICLFMHNPMEVHMHALRRILRYIQGTKHYGLHLYPSSITSLISYTDADWGDALILDDLPLVTVCSLEIIYFHGHPKGNPPYLALVLKSNIVELPMWYLNLAGYEISYSSYSALFTRPPWSTVTM